MEIIGIFLSHEWVWYPFPSLENSQRNSENPVITHFIHKLGITKSFLRHQVSSNDNKLKTISVI